MPQKLIVFDPDKKIIFLPVEAHGGYTALPPSFRRPDVLLAAEGDKAQILVPATRSPETVIRIPRGISLVTYAQFGRVLEPTYAYEIYKYFLNFLYLPTQVKIAHLVGLTDRAGLPVNTVEFFNADSAPIEELSLTPLKFSDVSTNSYAGKNLVTYYQYMYQDLFKLDLQKVNKRRTGDFRFDYFRSFGLTLNHFFKFGSTQEQVPLSVLLTRVLNVFASQIARGWTVEIHLFACRSAIGESYVARRPDTRGLYDLSGCLQPFERQLCSSSARFNQNYLFSNDALYAKNKTLVCTLSPPVSVSTVSVSAHISISARTPFPPSLNVVPPTTIEELTEASAASFFADTALPPHEFASSSGSDMLPLHQFLDLVPDGGLSTSSSSGVATSYSDLYSACNTAFQKFQEAFDAFNSNGQKTSDVVVKTRFYFQRIINGLKKILERIQTLDRHNADGANDEINKEIMVLEEYCNLIAEYRPNAPELAFWAVFKELWEKFLIKK
jgi:hypothetical protein